MRIELNDNAAMFCIIAIICLIAGVAVVVDGCGTKEKNNDPIAERIRAIENANLGMSDESKERLISEALKGNTNSAEVILERK